MSTSLAEHLIQDMTFIPTIKFMWSLSGHIIHSLGIQHILPIQVEGTLVHLSFYIIDTWDFHLLIGQPFRWVLYEGQSRNLKFYLCKKLLLPLYISHYLNSRTEPYPQEEPLEEFRATSLEFLVKPGLQDKARFFIEEADPSEEEPLDEFAVTPKSPIVLRCDRIANLYTFKYDCSSLTRLHTHSLTYINSVVCRVSRMTSANQLYTKIAWLSKYTSHTWRFAVEIILQKSSQIIIQV